MKLQGGNMKSIVKVFRLCLLMLMFLILPGGLLAGDSIEIPAGFVGKHIDVQGIQIRYHQVGSGPDILFIHGLPGSIEDWQPVIGELAGKYRLTFYDRPGNGFSSAEHLEYSLKQNADIALALIDRLQLSNPIVVGHSYGGCTALAMAVRKPSRVKAFVIVGGVAYPTEKVDPLFYLLRIPVLGRGIIALIPHSAGCKMMRDGILKAFTPNDTSIPDDFIDMRCKIWSQPKNLVTMAREDIQVNLDLKEIGPRYKDIVHTLYIVHGEQDQMVSVEESKKLHAILPSSKLILLEHTGHMVQYARLADLIKVIEMAATSSGV
jgi:pimeloyl-ACP methyl ester carboxylesterase